MSLPPSPETLPTLEPLDLGLLAGRAARGEPAALEHLARRTQPILESHARRALARQRRSACDVDDLVQEVVAEVQAFLAAAGPAGPGWRRFEAARARGASAVEGWLFGIVRNKVRRRLRDLRRQEALAQDALPEPTGHAWQDQPGPDRAIDGARALALVSALPPRERDALSLWLADEPSREIAARLRFASAHAVDCCLNRGKRRLRLLLEGDPGDAPLPRAA